MIVYAICALALRRKGCFVAANVIIIRAANADARKGQLKMKRYMNDKRTLTMGELEKFLLEYYGEMSDVQEYDRGCNINGKWFSINTILEIVSERV